MRNILLDDGYITVELETVGSGFRMIVSGPDLRVIDGIAEIATGEDPFRIDTGETLISITDLHEMKFQLAKLTG